MTAPTAVTDATHTAAAATGLRIALPNGALLEGACALVSRAGLASLQPSDFDRVLLLDDGRNEWIKVRPTDVPVYVELGGADAGIVGKDMLWEARRDLYELVDLGFGRCRLVLAVPNRSPIARGEWPPSIRVATKYPHAAAAFFDRVNVVAELVKLHGSIELAPATGLADAILDITATGRTLVANDLVEVAEAGWSTARLIVNHASLKTRSASVDALATALRRAVS
ncbi:MAG TPA: ATP phosphoribosyltransferase [Candidatus Dormibacteraeota bacterium]|nr:ATP phosphoribosyltransferase [Candidatus Dormibacteraeota bacterium]